MVWNWLIAYGFLLNHSSKLLHLGTDTIDIKTKDSILYVYDQNLYIRKYN